MRCEHLRCVMAGRACVGRQRATFRVRGAGGRMVRKPDVTKGYCTSGKCEQGAEVMVAIGSSCPADDGRETRRVAAEAAHRDIVARIEERLDLVREKIGPNLSLAQVEGKPLSLPQGAEEKSMDAAKKSGGAQPGGKCRVCQAPLYTNSIARGTCPKHKGEAPARKPDPIDVPVVRRKAAQQATPGDFAGVIADLEARRDKLDQAIQALRRLA